MTDLESVNFFRDGALQDDPYAYFDALRAQSPVWQEPHYGVFMVTGHEEALAVYNDSTAFSSCNAVSGPFKRFPEPFEGDDVRDLIERYRDELPFSDQLPAFDPPRHTAHRALMMRLLTPGRLRANEEFMGRLADRQLDELVEAGGCEFISAYAAPFTLLVIADLEGVPESDHGLFTARLTKLPEDLEHKPLEFLYEQFTAYIEDRRRTPRDDIMTAMATATFPDGRGSVIRNGRDGVAEPDRPYRFVPPVLDSPAGAEPRTAAAPRRSASTDAPELPFQGLRVLDLTAFWAGPLCTHVLAMLGAEVLHLESTARPDGTRLLAGLRSSEPGWWERSGIFAGLNTNKRGLALDLGTDKGRELLRRLIATCDVIVENYTPRVLEHLGFDPDAVRAIRPDVVMVRMPGFGLDGPWRDEPAFAFVIEDASGLTWMTGYPDQNPLSPYCVGDSNAGLHALSGLLLALEHRRRTGEGVVVEAAMVDAALSVAAEQVVEHSAHGALLGRDGNRGPTAAPQNLYLASDVDEAGARDTWVAIAVASNEQWLALRGVLGEPGWAMDPGLATASGRRRHHDAIDRHLGRWCAERPADEIVDLLWAAAIPVARVVQPHEQASLPQLEFRRFFEEVDHPVAGTARHSTLPMRFSRRPARFHRRPAPRLGEHTDEVLRGLGVPDDELARLEKDGVIGRTPDAAKRSK